MKRWSLFPSLFLLAILFYWSPLSAEEGCVICHRELGGRLSRPVKDWQGSVHQEVGVSCFRCHGGNPVSYDHAMDRVTGFVGKPGPKEGVFLCARCHADVRMMRQYGLRTDQFSEYKASIHGKRLLEKGDPNVATCISCHGAHNILKKDSPYSSIYRLNIPKMCAKCHSDKNTMKPYKIPTNQMEEYQKSYHGKLLLEEGDFRAPTCADCHGVHGATPPGITEVANVCGTCHFVIAGYFKEGSHERAMRAVGVPKCVSCHGIHYMARAGEELFSGNEKSHCGSCHRENSEAYRLGQEIREVIYGTMSALGRAENGILELKKKGLEVSDLEAAALEARARIIETKPVSHTLALTRVKALSREALRDIRGIEEEAEKLRHQLYIRKKALTIALTLVLVMIALLYIKKKSLD